MIEAETILDLTVKLIRAGENPRALCGQMDREPETAEWFFSYMARVDGELQKVGTVTQPMLNQEHLDRELATAQAFIATELDTKESA